MRQNRMLLAAVLVTCSAGPAAAHGSSAARLGPGEKVTVAFSHALPDLPGKTLVANEVSYRPGGRSYPHHHARSAFIYAYVVEGSVRSQVAGEPVRVYTAGKSFYEVPGAHHLVSENASRTKPAKLLAVFVVDTTEDKTLTITDNK